eukprot:9477338-Pyramimonas_sp.AAC.1
MLSECAATNWPQVYYDHPVYRKCQAENKPPPLALGIYTDGVRYQSPLSANCDTMTGYWIVNMTTHKRHLLGIWRNSLNCRCGCKGWHSTWSILNYTQYCLRAMARGKRPRVNVSGEEWASDHIMSTMLKEYGENLGFCALVGWLRGDWSDVNKTHGVPSVSSSNNPCPFCQCTREDMHDHYKLISLDFLPWEPVRP